MKTKQFYIDRLQIINTYLHNNYNQTISIDELEALSHFSYRNLQRIFKGYYNETIGAFISRIKVEQAAKQLLFTNQVIKEIAYHVGFSNVQSLSKAFKKHFGISPSNYRKRKEELLAIVKTENKINMSFFENRIEKLPEKKVIYKSYKGDYYNTEINTVWETLYDEALSNNVINKNAESFGIIWDEPIITDSIKCNYDACFTIVKDKKIKVSKFKTKTIPSNKYAVFKHYGDYKSINLTYNKIFSQWLFNTNKEVTEAPFLEFYIKHDGNTNSEQDFETDIYIPIKN